MTNACIKTGAVVLFKDYGFKLPADIFKVGTAIVIRAHRGALAFGKETKDYYQNKEATHEVRSSTLSPEFWRDDLGVFVVESEMFKELPTKGEKK